MKSWEHDKGLSIVQILVATVLLTGLMLAGSRYFSSMTKSSRKLESSLDLSGVKVRLLDAVSCSKTLAAAPTCMTLNPYVTLKDEANRDLVRADGTTAIGSYNVRARCNPGPNGGIEVRAARLKAAGKASDTAKNFGSTTAAWFGRDEVNTSLLYNWNHPKADIFVAASGAAGDTRLCREFFNGPPVGATITCPDPTTFMIGYNTLTKEPICRKIETLGVCPSGQFMVGIDNGTPVCRDNQQSNDGCARFESVGEGRLGSSVGCPAGMYARTGGGFCNNSNPSSVHHFCNDGLLGFLHNSQPKASGRGWVIDCYSMTAGTDVCSRAFVYCCPD